MRDYHTCRECGAPFKPVRDWQKFCSDYCRLLAFRKRKRPDKGKEEKDS
jgi:hypothetical protein